MAKKHKIKTRGWHHPAKILEKSISGKCEFCKKRVENLEAHMRKVHQEKII